MKPEKIRNSSILKNSRGSLVVLGAILISTAFTIFTMLVDLNKFSTYSLDVQRVADLAATAAAREYANHRATANFSRIQKTAQNVLVLNPHYGGIRAAYTIHSLDVGYYNADTGQYSSYSSVADSSTDPSIMSNWSIPIARLLDQYALSSGQPAPTINSVRISISSNANLSLIQALFNSSGIINIQRALSASSVAQFCANNGSVRLYGTCTSYYSCSGLDPLYKACTGSGQNLSENLSYTRVANASACPDATQEGVCDMYPACGDSVYDSATPYSEQCDKGLDTSPRCNSTCKCVNQSISSPMGSELEGKCTMCGNGRMDFSEGEECELLNGTWNADCGPSGDESDQCHCLHDTVHYGAMGCSLCGNGQKDSSEQCDDGNQLSGDGCSNSCLCESGLVYDAFTGNCVPDTGRTCSGYRWHYQFTYNGSRTGMVPFSLTLRFIQSDGTSFSKSYTGVNYLKRANAASVYHGSLCASKALSITDMQNSFIANKVFEKYMPDQECNCV